MRFLHLFNKFSSTHDGFASIQGYEDIKDIVMRALNSRELQLAFCRPTRLFQDLIPTRQMRSGVYLDGSNTASRILDMLEENRPKIICIDELDEMSRQLQNQLLNFMESRHIKVDQIRRQYNFEIKGAKMFATANDISPLSKPLQSRFRKHFLPRYTEEQFLDVAESVAEEPP